MRSDCSQNLSKVVMLDIRLQIITWRNFVRRCGMLDTLGRNLAHRHAKENVRRHFTNRTLGQNSVEFHSSMFSPPIHCYWRQRRYLVGHERLSRHWTLAFFLACRCFQLDVNVDDYSIAFYSALSSWVPLTSRTTHDEKQFIFASRTLHHGIYRSI